MTYDDNVYSPHIFADLTYMPDSGINYYDTNN